MSNIKKVQLKRSWATRHQLQFAQQLDRHIEYGYVIVGDGYLFRSISEWGFEGGEAVGGGALKN